MEEELDAGLKVPCAYEAQRDLLGIAKEIAFKAIDTHSSSFKAEDIAEMVNTAYIKIAKKIFAGD